jgi:hypothetical protein
VEAAFDGKGIEKMKQFWVSEHATTPGHCGGGLQYMVARTFQNAKGAIDVERTPTYDEARVQIDSFILYQTMNKRQRIIQSRINKALMQHVQPGAEGSILKLTYVPEYKDQARLYGKSGNLSLYNLLPTPPVENIDGVAFISPINIARYMFANGVPIDDFWIGSSRAESSLHATFDGKVHHVQQCRKATQFATEMSQLLGKDNEATVLCPTSAWLDGFGPNRNKNKFLSVDCQTFIGSAPKDLTNALDNTSLMALGLASQSTGWEKVQKRIREDMRVLSGEGGKPFMVYHGKLQKVIPVVFRCFAHIADKIQRPYSTYTVGSGSDWHRCFGYSARIRTPNCKVDGIERFLAKEKEGKVESSWSWCDAYVEGDETGAKLPFMYPL